MTVKLRQELERRIAKAAIDGLLSEYPNCSISVNNGGEENELDYSRDKAKILNAMFQSDEDTLMLFACVEGVWLSDNRNRRGWVYFVYGNDGYDVISDYTVNLEDALRAANALADKYAP